MALVYLPTWFQAARERLVDAGVREAQEESLPGDSDLLYRMVKM